MTTANGRALADETPGRWQSLLSTLKALVEALDYDPQMQTYASIHELVATVSQLEARVSVLEGQDGNTYASTSFEIKERD